MFKVRVWDKVNKRYFFPAGVSVPQLDTTATGTQWVYIYQPEFFMKELDVFKAKKEDVIIEKASEFEDKNKKTIYENDVLFCASSKEKFTMKYHKFGWYLLRKSGGISYINAQHDFTLFEIIGNLNQE